MRNKIKLSILAIFAGTMLQAQAQDELRIGVEGAYPPFSEMTAKGEVVGFDIDIANALCTQMKRNCKLVQIDWDGLIPAVKSNKIQAIIASMTATPERMKNISFSERYYRIPVKLIRKKGQNFEFSKAGLKGKVIGLQRSTTFDKQITDLFSDVATIKRYGSTDEAYLDLEAGRVDVVVAESMALKQGFLDKPAGKDYEFFGPDLVDPKYYGNGIAVGVNKGNQKLADEFSKAIKEIRANGVYKKINDKYFDFDIYGK